MERGRKRQAIVPDFRIEMPTPTGGTCPQLAELKIISCCETWYPAGRIARGTKRGVQEEGQEVDQEVLGLTDGEKGPVERRLE